MWDGNKGVDFQMTRNRIAYIAQNILNKCHELKVNQTRDFVLFNQVLKDTNACHE